MLKLACSLFGVLCLLGLTAANNNPLGNCEGGRAVPYTLAASGGICNLPVKQFPVAQVNQAYFGSGLQCGQCYQVTGPLGMKVVQIVDICDNITFRCGGDKVNFGIDETTFGLIADRNSVDVIYDLGFRQVTCDVTGNVQMQALSGTTSSQYYFSLAFWNFRVGIVDVRVQASGWASTEQLVRQGSTGVWAWNKRNNDLKFPVTIFVVGITNEIIKGQVSVLSSFSGGGVLDLGSQFADVAGGTGVCPMASSPSIVYLDTVSYGWATSYSFNLTSPLNLAYTTNPYAGTQCITVGLQSTGGVQFTRLGGFNPQYFTTLTFAARADSGADLRVYMGNGGSISSTVTLTSAWQQFNIPVTSLTTSSLETALVFFNPTNAPVQYYFDEIQWVLNPVSPAANVTQVTTGGYIFNTSTTGPVDVIQATTGGFGGNDTSGAFSTAASLVVFFIALAVAMIAW